MRNEHEQPNNQLQITICEMKKKNIVLFIYDYVWCAVQLIWVKCVVVIIIESLSIRFGVRIHSLTQSEEQCKILRLTIQNKYIHNLSHATRIQPLTTFNSHSLYRYEDYIFEWRTSKNFHMCDFACLCSLNSSMKTYVKSSWMRRKQTA